MNELSETQLSGVRSLIEAVPDDAVRMLERML